MLGAIHLNNITTYAQHVVMILMKAYHMIGGWSFRFFVFLEQQRYVQIYMSSTELLVTSPVSVELLTGAYNMVLLLQSLWQTQRWQSKTAGCFNKEAGFFTL